MNFHLLGIALHLLSALLVQISRVVVDRVELVLDTSTLRPQLTDLLVQACELLGLILDNLLLGDLLDRTIALSLHRRRHGPRTRPRDRGVRSPRFRPFRDRGFATLQGLKVQ